MDGSFVVLLSKDYSSFDQLVCNIRIRVRQSDRID